MKNLHALCIVGFSLAFTACTTTQSTTSTTTGVYDEDLTGYLKKYDAIAPPEKIKINPAAQGIALKETTVPRSKTVDLPTKHDNIRMDSLMAALYEFNKTVTSIQGYRISVYSGADRQEAQRIENDIQRNLQENAEMSYDKPNFRVRVGSYIQRLEAYKTYKKVQKSYPNAIIVLDKINIDARRKR